MGLGTLGLLFDVDGRATTRKGMVLGDEAQTWVELLATVVALWDAEVAATAWAEQALVPVGILDMLDQAWRVEGDATETALDAVGSSHPDKLVAKAARKALFKFRSAG